MPETEKPTLESLAQIVIEWAKYDRSVAEKGWDGGAIESGWDKAKKKMVEMSAKVLGVNAP